MPVGRPAGAGQEAGQGWAEALKRWRWRSWQLFLGGGCCGCSGGNPGQGERDARAPPGLTWPARRKEGSQDGD